MNREGYLKPTQDGHYKVFIRDSDPYGEIIEEQKIRATKELQEALEKQSHVLDDGSYLLSELTQRIDGLERILKRAGEWEREKPEEGVDKYTIKVTGKLRSRILESLNGYTHENIPETDGHHMDRIEVLKTRFKVPPQDLPIFHRAVLVNEGDVQGGFGTLERGHPAYAKASERVLNRVENLMRQEGMEVRS